MPTRAKILIVDDDTDVQRLLAYTLRQDGYDTVVAADGRQALKVFTRNRPSLVLLDVSLPKMDGYQVATKMRAAERTGHVPIVLLSEATDVELRVKALRAGADDSLSKPVRQAELSARVKSLLVRFAPIEAPEVGPTSGQILTFYGAKGGVGTTTLAVNTAIALHREHGRRVVLVDGNLQFGDHRVFLDMDIEGKSLIDVVSAPALDVDLLRQVIVRDVSGIDVLLGPPTPEAADAVSPEDLPAILELLKPIYDYVIVDIDKRLDDANLRVIDAGDKVFIVLTADLSSLKNVRVVLETIARLGYDPTTVRLVLNRSTASTGINLKNAEMALEKKIDYKVVNDYRGAISALNSGSPFMFARPDASISRSVREFARAIERPGAAPRAVVAAKR